MRTHRFNFGLIIAAAFFLLPGWASVSRAEPDHVCTVLERMDAGGYTFFRCKEADSELWAAVPLTKMAVGASVTFPDAPPMLNFNSRTLKRTFERLIFASKVEVDAGNSSETETVEAVPEAVPEAEPQDDVAAEGDATTGVTAIQDPNEATVRSGMALLEKSNDPDAVSQGLSRIQSAAFAGNANAQQKLSELYAQGKVVPYSRKEALTWRLTALAQKRLTAFGDPSLFPLPAPPDGSAIDPLLVKLHASFAAVRESSGEARMAALRDLWVYEGQWEILPAVQSLVGNSLSQKIEGAQTFGKRFYAPAVPYLLPLLDDPETELRMYALRAIAAQNERIVVPRLAKLLDDPELGVRATALTAISILAGRDALDYLKPLLADRDETIRLRAACATAPLGEELALPVLADALRSEYPRNIPSLLDPWSESPKTEMEYRLTLAGGFRNFGSRAVSTLAGILREGNPQLKIFEESPEAEKGNGADYPNELGQKNEEIRSCAALSLGLTGAQEGVAPLTAALSDKSEKVRWAAVFGLLLLHDDRGVEALAEMAGHGDLKRFLDHALWDVFQLQADLDPTLAALARKARTLPGEGSVQFVHLIGYLGGKTALGPLKLLLDDPEKPWALAAAEELLQLGDASGMEVFRRMTLSADGAVREAGIQRLALLKSPQANDLLFAAAKDPDPAIAGKATAALLANGDRRGFSAADRVLDEEYPEQYFDGLAAIGGEEAIALLTKALFSPKERVREQAAQTLGEMDARSALPALRAGLQADGVQWLERLRIATSLLTLGDSSVVDRMVALLDAGADQNGSGISEYASFWEKAAAMGFTDGVVRLFSVERDDFYSQMLLDILARHGVAELSPVLRHGLRDPEHWRESLAALPAETMAPALYQAFAEQPAPYYFGEILDRQLFDPAGVEGLLAGGDRSRMSYGWYLKALKESIGGTDAKQLELVAKVLELADPDRDPELVLLSLWLKAQAEIGMGRAPEAVETLKKGEPLLTRIRPAVMFAFKKSYGPDHDYLRAVAFAAAGRTAEAEQCFARALNELNLQQVLIRKVFGIELSGDLRARILKGLGAVQIRSGVENLQTGIELGRNHEVKDRFSLDQEQASYETMIGLKLGEKVRDEEGIYRLVEELESRRVRFLSKQINFSFADEKKQRRVQEYRDREAEIDRLEKSVAAQTDGSAGPTAQKLKGEVVGLSAEKGVGDGVFAADATGIGGAEPEGGKGANVGSTLRQKNAELKKYLTRLQRSDPELALLLGAKPIDLKLLQDRLPERTAFIQYLLLKESAIVIVLKSDGPESISIPVPRAKFQTLVKRFRKRVKGAEKGDLDAESWLESDRELYDLLIKPIEDRKLLEGVDVLGISPNGPLHLLPFASLTGDGKSPLGSRFSLFYANSSSLFAIASQKSEELAKDPKRKPRLIAFVDPDGSLPEILTREMPEIRRQFSPERVKEYSGKSATLKAVNAEDYAGGIVHFSTHGVFTTKQDSSFLVLSDGMLTVQDIWGLRLGGSSLVTLSACETGMGEVLSGDEVISLENAFFYAGAPSVLATLWKVESESAAILTGAFYRHLMSGKNKALALRLAQEEVRNNREHDFTSPYFWAGYTLRGAWQ